MIVLATEFVPGDKDGRITPVGAVHDQVDFLCDKILGRLFQRWWVIRRTTWRSDPGHGGHFACIHISRELINAMNVAGRAGKRLDHNGGIPDWNSTIKSPAKPGSSQ